MTNAKDKFDELVFFAQVKNRPGIFLGKPSLLSFRDQLLGLEYAFSFCNQEHSLKYFRSFVKWYHKEVIKDSNGYACWWNHILYISGNNDVYAFEVFFNNFERYLRDVHNISLPEICQKQP